MALHEQSVGATNEWYTPAYVFDAMGVRFDLDVATPDGGAPWVPADNFISRSCDGLTTPWNGFVWMNPPFGGRNGLVPWLEKFFQHGNGVALVPDRTSAPWWQDYARRADLLLFVGKKIRFIGSDGQPGKSPAQGTTLMAAGPLGVRALIDCPVCGAVDKERERQAVEITDGDSKISEFILNWFAPWGSWKTAWWEMEVSDDVEMSDANALKHLRNLATKGTAV